jgi:dipeptidase D
MTPPAAVAGADAAPATAADETTAQLEPQPIFSLFAELARIPRASGNERAALNWIKAKADALGLEHAQDARGNLVVRRPAGPGCENAPIVILQGHVDMVTEKNEGVSHDWARDPVRLRVEEAKHGGAHNPAAAATTTTPTTTWLRAEGTTLGADNGIGVCAAMAVLALPKDTPLPPLEVLVTVEEEIGLLGASALDANMLRGTVLLNLDSEEWPSVTIGCAGAGDAVVESGGLEVEELAGGGAANVAWLRLTIDGLSGGHSGLQIHEGRGNAVQMLASAARAVRRAVAKAGGAEACLGWISGGDKRNAIAREARCDLAIVVDAAAEGGTSKPHALVEAREAAAAAVERLAACWREEYGSVEPGLRVTLCEDEKEQEQDSSSPLGRLLARSAALSEPAAERVLALLSVLPHGPVRMSPAMPGLVETSCNTASVRLTADEDEEGGGVPSSTTTTVRALVQVSTRSSFPHAIDEMRDRIALAAKGAGATRVSLGEPYAGWAPDPSSRLAQVVARCVAEADGGLGGDASRVPIVALHAGLECGVLREKLLSRGGAGGGGQVEIVSFGPTILGAHSPDERVDVGTTDKFWRALLSTLAELGKQQQA